VPIHPFLKLLHLSLGLLARQSVALLQFSGELFGMTFELLQVILGQLAPLLLQLSPDLVPRTRSTIACHERPP
jgi:hypothetical protein